MPWVMLFVGSAFVGVAVLGVCAVRVHAAVRRFGRQLERTRERLAHERVGLARELSRLEETRE